MKIFSAGFNCTSAEITKALNIRVTGPIDWANNTTDPIEGLMSLMSGDVLEHLLNRNWSNKTNYYDEILRDGVLPSYSSINNFEYIHQNFKDPVVYKSVLRGALNFEDYMNCITSTSEYKRSKYLDTYILLTLNPKFNSDFKNLVKFLKYMNFPTDKLVIITPYTEVRNEAIANKLLRTYQLKWIKDMFTECTTKKAVKEFREKVLVDLYQNSF